VGRHLAQALCEAGWNVHGIDVKPLGSQDDPPEWFEECRDLRRFCAYPGRTDFDLIIHCAAVVGGRATIERQPLAVATDLAIDSDLFNWLTVLAKKRQTPPRVVYFSSSAAYPWHLQVHGIGRALHEDDIVVDEHEVPSDRRLSEPDHIYGWVKLTGEKLAKYAMNRYGIPVRVLRPFSGYGPDQDPDYPFPALIQRARDRQTPFEVWGPGHQMRDFIHIDDVVAATMAVIDDDSDPQDWEPINLCTGIGTSFYQLAEICLEAAGYETWVSTNPDAPTGVHTRVGNPDRMHRYWVPKIAIEQGVRDALHWQG
jgi:nucleoside-diphosphate-sugar epimerase